MQQRGFTLIELLLVIAILSILASISISTFRVHQINQRVERAALEMQSFMGAALNFQADQGAWPKAYNDLSTCSMAPPDGTAYAGFITYLPNASTESTFGSYYCWSSIGASQSIFWVALKIPNNDIVLAKRIAALLPNAFATANPLANTLSSCTSTADCYVRMEVTGMGINSVVGTYIAGIGNCEPGKTTLGSGPDVRCQYLGQDSGPEPKKVNYSIEFNCPSGTKGGLLASVNYLDVGKAKGDPYVMRTLEFSYACDEKNTPTHCNLKIDAMRDMGWSVASGARGHIGASYTAFCGVKPKKIYSY